MYLFDNFVSGCLCSVLISLRFLRRLSPSFPPTLQLLGLEQTAAPVCAVGGFISWWAVLVFHGACVCVVFGC